MPTFSGPVVVERINADDLRIVWLDEAVEGIGDNRLYAQIAEVSWTEVQAAIDGESDVVGRAASDAKTNDEFDSLADRLVDDRYTGEWDIDGPVDDGPLARFHMLDLGVMSAVAALVAAGSLTTTSCRGHHSGRGEPRPLVRFICDDLRLPLITSAATNAGCGLELDSGDMLQLYASDIEALIRFAGEMVARREAFDAVPMEGVFESREVYGSYLDEYEAHMEIVHLTRKDLARIRQMMAAGRSIEGQLTIFEVER